MQYTSYLPIYALIFFVFRIWICEAKLRETFDYKRHYFSRVLNIFLCMAMINDFQYFVFNITLVTCVPTLVLALLIWDVNFYKRLRKNWATWDNKGWLILERLTLHPPILIIGLMPYFSQIFGMELTMGSLTFTGLREFMLGNVASTDIYTQIISTIFALIMNYSAVFFFDKRYYDKKGWPTAKYMLEFITVSSIFTISVIIIPTIFEILAL